MVDPEQELFWKEVAKAVQMVEANHDRSLTVGVGTREAYIKWDTEQFVNGEDDEFLSIRIDERDPKQPALLVP